MRVLMLSTDKDIFSEASESRQRMIEYGRLVDELHIIIKTQNSKIKTQNFGNIFLYPTNSCSKWRYIRDVINIGKEILKTSGQWIITTQDPFETGFAGYRLAKKFHLPLHLQIHTDFLSPYFWRESFLNKIRVLLAKFLIPRAACIRVVSERIKKSIQDTRYKIQDTKIAVLPIFIDVEKIRSSSIQTDLHKKYPQFEFIILMASRFTKEKNIGLAIKTMKEVAEKFPKTGLVIVGAGPEEENLKLKIKNLKLHNNIVLEPWTDDLTSYYKNADLFLLTSNYEGYGRTVVEALAGECPVIMTDVGVAGDLVKNGYNGIIVSVGDKERLKRAILSLIGDQALRTKLRFSSEDIIRRLPTKSDYLIEYKNSWQSCI